MVFVFLFFLKLEESLLVTTGVLYHSIVCFVGGVCCDSAILSFKFLTRLPGVCSGGGRGDPPETLNGLTRNPLSYTR